MRVWRCKTYWEQQPLRLTLKQQQKQKKLTKAVDLKQIRLGMRIGENDLDIKTNKIRKFLEAGHKVKVMLLYRGRENAHKDLGFTIFIYYSKFFSTNRVI